MRRVVMFSVVGMLIVLMVVAIGCGGSSYQSAQGDGAQGLPAGGPPPGGPPPGGPPPGGGAPGDEAAPGGPPPEAAGGMPADDGAGAMPGDAGGMVADDGGMPGDMGVLPGAEDMAADAGGPPPDGAGGMPGDIGLPGAGGYPGGRMGPAKPPEGFRERAEYLFAEGQETDAIRYLYAWALTSDEGAAELLPKIQWVSGLRSPQLAVRWGVGVHITPDHLERQAEEGRIDLKPIGVLQALATGRVSGRGEGGARGGLGALGDAGMAGGEMGRRGLSQGTPMEPVIGELGNRLIDQFETRVADAKFGEVLRDAPQPGTRTTPGQPAPGMMEPAGGMPADAMPAGGMPGDAGVMPGAEDAAGAMPGAEMPRRRPIVGRRDARRGLLQIAPGISFVGFGKQEDLLQKAAREGLQVLAFFEVQIGQNPSKTIITNETSVRLLDVARKDDAERVSLYPPDKKARPQRFKNTEVQLARAKNKKDGIEDEFRKIFEFVDQNLTMGNFPEALTPQVVQSRASFLASGKHENPLPVLVEILFWQRKNLLSEEELLNSFKQLLGDEPGAQLVMGDEEAKKKALAKWLPKL